MSDELRAAVAALCDPRKVRVLRDDGTADWTQIPSLLEQLAGAVGSNATFRERRGGGGGGSPVDLDAIDILDGLRSTLADWRGRAGHTGRVTLDRAARQVAVHPWPELEAAQLARLLEGHARRAEAHLCPPDVAPARYVRDTACPACDARSVSAADAYGDAGRVPALVIMLNRGLVRYVACQACGQQWSRWQLESWAIGLPA